ncbi:hypothetical protein [Brevibacterium moorei]|uniref:hypothetical protein n=1 Tax=Brevibacterium moorei TaxID=2968457 RepID=UPI00211BE571|nr:hypothetical protein [Brevibacterium sp. 68QC2CO]MCQ9384410.1 hypothetical protein [Brevibacterium sp. 68QC2CO]
MTAADNLQAVMDLHQPVMEFEYCMAAIFPPEGPCPVPDCQHATDRWGDVIHQNVQLGQLCQTCRDDDGQPVPYPCPTAALASGIPPATPTAEPVPAPYVPRLAVVQHD